MDRATPYRRQLCLLPSANVFLSDENVRRLMSIRRQMVPPDGAAAMLNV